MAVHKPGSVWSLRKPGTFGNAYVQTASTETLYLNLPLDPGGRDRQRVEISRKDARLLAKRINACLDATTSKGN